MPEDKSTGFAVNTPDLNERTLEPKTRSIRNEKEAGALSRHLIEQHRERNRKNARIMAKCSSTQIGVQVIVIGSGRKKT